MKQSQNYVLIVGDPSGAPLATESMSQTLSCPVIAATSPTQALALAQSAPPHLVILSGDDGITWSHSIVRQLRKSIQTNSVMIVAVTGSSEPSWLPREDNPEIDGFFVEPISADVLSTLNESAITKKRCLQLV